jgi:plasmid stabilization system protein ParE
MKIIRRSRFLLDVEEEVDNLSARAGAATAARWLVSLKRTIKQLSRHPQLGRPRSDLKPNGIRSWRVDHFRRWLIFYQVKEDALVLLRVRYGMMDLPSMAYES